MTAARETEFVDRHIAMRERIEELMQEYTALQYETDLARERNELGEGSLADIGFTERETEKALDHQRKEAKSRQLSIGAQLCAIIMERFGSGMGELKCRGRIANATPDIKEEPIIPKKGDESYDAIMESIGIPADLARAGVVGIHYKNMGEYLTELSAQGKNPPGRLLKRAVPQVIYRSNTRKKKT